MGGMGGGSDVRFKMSHEQKWLLDQLAPMLMGIGQQGATQAQKPNLGAPTAPYLGASVAANVPMYDIPDTSSMMPGKGWYSGLDSSIKAGLHEPWEQAGRSTLELMGSRGQTGGAGTGYTGAAGVALGELASKEAQVGGMQAWNMISPALRKGWGADLDRNITGYGARMQDYQQDYQNEASRLMADYQMEQNVWGMPYKLLGAAPQMVQGTPIVSQDPNYWGVLGSGMKGGVAGGAAGGVPGGVAGAVGGILEGLGNK